MSTDVQVIDATPEEHTAATQIATSRAAQEVQAMMIVAKRFPRDENRSISRILRACQRIGLAENAIYSYPRGGTKVEGPSIRLAEVVAQGWGNLDCGVIELEQNTITGESSLMAYAWDLETNTRVSKVWTVKHERSKRSGNVRLTDPRDIYEMVANQGARRLRACILAIVPSDITDRALTECNKTLAGGTGKPLLDRVTDMVLAFEKLAVTEEMVRARLGHNLDATSENELVGLRKIFASLRDGMSDRFDWFTNPDAPADKPASDTPPSEAEMNAGELGDSKRKGELPTEGKP